MQNKTPPPESLIQDTYEALPLPSEINVPTAQIPVRILKSDWLSLERDLPTSTELHEFQYILIFEKIYHKGLAIGWRYCGYR